jgi:N-sulfoglucosamine sulfohydrolase
MVSQDDFLISNKMPLINPTLHPSDRNSKWNKMPEENLKRLNLEDYLKSHY